MPRTVCARFFRQTCTCGRKKLANLTKGLDKGPYITAIGLRLVWQSYPRIEPNVISIRQAGDLLVVFTHIRLPSDSTSQ